MSSETPDIKKLGTISTPDPAQPTKTTTTLTHEQEHRPVQEECGPVQPVELLCAGRGVVQHQHRTRTDTSVRPRT